MKPEHFIKLIREINKRPGMYAVNRVEDINLIIFGYSYAPFDSEEKQSLSQLLADFRAFVNNHYERKDNYDWVKLIRFYSGSDSHTRETFADLFSKFVKSQGYKDE